MKKLSRIFASLIFACSVSVMGTANAGTCTGTVNTFYVQSGFLFVRLDTASGGGFCFSYSIEDTLSTWASMLGDARSAGDSIKVTTNVDYTISKVEY